jgi:hypothetical protein
MHYPKEETYASTLTRWNGLEERKDGSPYEIELYSDSDWASYKTVNSLPSSLRAKSSSSVIPHVTKKSSESQPQNMDAFCASE